MFDESNNVVICDNTIHLLATFYSPSNHFFVFAFHSPLVLHNFPVFLYNCAGLCFVVQAIFGQLPRFSHYIPESSPVSTHFLAQSGIFLVKEV